VQLVQLRLHLRHLLLLAAREHSWCHWVADIWLLVLLRLWLHGRVRHLCRPALLRRLHLLLHVLLWHSHSPVHTSKVWLLLLTGRRGEVLHEVLGHWHQPRVLAHARCCCCRCGCASTTQLLLQDLLLHLRGCRHCSKRLLLYWRWHRYCSACSSHCCCWLLHVLLLHLLLR
jgi:hypothetical protein